MKIWAARNRGAISAHIEGGGAVTPFKQRSQPITAYIPGLAGLSEKETILAQPLMRRHAASGDAGGVLRNVLYNLATTQTEEKAGSGLARLSKLNEYLYAIHPGYLVEVSFDEREDIHINATYSQAAKNSEGVIVPLSASRPLENLATGILQVVQIFAYLVLFRPRLLLVDEPDAHLHPDKQERLIETLEKAALDVGTQVVITTHSQHVVRGASQSTQLIWMDGGEVVSGNEKSIRTLMGWGALDKKAIFFVEDKEDQAVRSILRQWPELNRQLSICKCYGVDNLPRHPLIEGLLEEGEIQLKVLIHRDRDFMSEVEGDMWAGQYKNTFPWITKYVDVEAYFCQPEYLSALYGVPLAVSSAWVVSAANNVSQALETFKNKRNTINRLLYPDGGTPNSVELWKKHGEKGPSTVLGKSLHKALKPIVKAAGHDSHRLHAFEIPQGFEVAPDLRNVVETALSSR